jgi:hypothetical protein
MSVIGDILRWAARVRKEPLLAAFLTVLASLACAVGVRMFTFHTEFCLVSTRRGCYEQPLTTGDQVTGVVAFVLAALALAGVVVVVGRWARRLGESGPTCV